MADLRKLRAETATLAVAIAATTVVYGAHGFNYDWTNKELHRAALENQLALITKEIDEQETRHRRDAAVVNEVAAEFKLSPQAVWPLLNEFGKERLKELGAKYENGTTQEKLDVAREVPGVAEPQSGEQKDPDDVEEENKPGLGGIVAAAALTVAADSGWRALAVWLNPLAGAMRMPGGSGRRALRRGLKDSEPVIDEKPAPVVIAATQPAYNDPYL